MRQASMFGRVGALLQRYPWAKAGVISGSIMSFADVAVQNVVEPAWATGEPTKKANAFALLPHWDPMRTAKWGICGLTLHGPYFFKMFGHVDRFFGPATTFANAVTKTAFVQVTVYPVYLTILFAYMGCLEGVPLTLPKETEEDTRSLGTLVQTSPLVEKVCRTVPESFLGGCVFWPVANTVNFAFCPAHLRVPYLAACGCAFNQYLSWLNARAKSENVGSVEVEVDAVLDLQKSVDMVSTAVLT